VFAILVGGTVAFGLGALTVAVLTGPSFGAGALAGVSSGPTAT